MALNVNQLRKFTPAAEPAPSIDAQAAQIAKAAVGTGITKKEIAQENTGFKLQFKKPLNEVQQAKKDLEIVLHKQILEAERTEQEEIQHLSFAKPSEFEWDESQLRALDGMQRSQFACLTGAAGTGKTTCERELIKRIELTMPVKNHTRYIVDEIDGKTVARDKYDQKLNLSIWFCAFTGRAVQQIKRAIPAEYHRYCSTIHRMLDYQPVEEGFSSRTGKAYKVFRPQKNALNPLQHKVIFIDEAGMLPIPLWNEILAAILPDTRVYMIGDINQLTPVMGRSIFGYAMLKWPTFELTKIHRQAEGDPIIGNAHKILNGMFPKKVENKFDIITVPASASAAANTVIKTVKLLYQRNEFDPLRDAIIVPQNGGDLGQVELNNQLVHLFNPPRKIGENIINRRTIIEAGRNQLILATGDKVMLLQNDNELGLTNGMTGVVTGINVNGSYTGKSSKLNVHSNADKDFDLDMDDLLNVKLGENAEIDVKVEDESENERAASHVLTVEFQTGEHIQEATFATVGQYKQIALAYAFTCHKAQGGEYPTVIVVCHSANSTMLTREWLYTAVTRARSRVVLICNDYGLQKALNRQRIRGNNVQEKAQAFIDWNNETTANEDQIPLLPEPAAIEVKTKWHGEANGNDGNYPG